jgi:hypothetical protein
MPFGHHCTNGGCLLGGPATIHPRQVDFGWAEATDPFVEAVAPSDHHANGAAPEASAVADFEPTGRPRVEQCGQVDADLEAIEQDSRQQQQLISAQALAAAAGVVLSGLYDGSSSGGKHRRGKPPATPLGGSEGGSAMTRRVRMAAASVVASVALLVGGFAWSADADTSGQQQGDALVNVQVGDITVSDINVLIAAVVVAQFCDTLDINAALLLVNDVDQTNNSQTACRTDLGRIRVAQN